MFLKNETSPSEASSQKTKHKHLPNQPIPHQNPLNKKTTTKKMFTVTCFLCVSSYQKKNMFFFFKSAYFLPLFKKQQKCLQKLRHRPPAAPPPQLGFPSIDRRLIEGVVGAHHGLPSEGVLGTWRKEVVEKRKVIQ